MFVRPNGLKQWFPVLVPVTLLFYTSPVHLIQLINTAQVYNSSKNVNKILKFKTEDGKHWFGRLLTTLLPSLGYCKHYRSEQKMDQIEVGENSKRQILPEM